MSFPNYSDDPADCLRNAMQHHADHLEPFAADSDIGRLKRRIESMRIELEARRFAHPEEKWHPPNGHHNGILTYNGVEMFDG